MIRDSLEYLATAGELDLKRRLTTEQIAALAARFSVKPWQIVSALAVMRKERGIGELTP